jgi:hypothetical protein
MELINYNKYENYIKVGSSPNNLVSFPTPSSIGYTLSDVDKDPFTDLEGYTHRNRVRHDVLSLQVSFSVLSESDISFILNAISPVWFYVQIKDKKTQQLSTHKMYASDKQFNVLRIIEDENGFHEINNDFQVTFVEE